MLPIASTAELRRSIFPSPSKSTANVRNDVGINWVCPMAPAHEQRMAARENGHEQFFDNLFLPDDDLGDLGAELRVQRAHGVDGGDIGVGDLRRGRNRGGRVRHIVVVNLRRTLATRLRGAKEFHGELWRGPPWAWLCAIRTPPGISVGNAAGRARGLDR